MILISILTVFFGIFYALFLFASKKRSLQKPQPIIDVILTLLRFALLIFIIFKIMTNISGNPILLMILFVSSYLSTITLLVYHDK